jgi:kinesin family protein C1
VSSLGRFSDKAYDQTDETAGLIPRAIDMIFTVSSQLRDRGWKYQMEGQFLEVYNEVVSSRLPSRKS